VTFARSPFLSHFFNAALEAERFLEANGHAAEVIGAAVKEAEKEPAAKKPALVAA
jgi:hypothetical protein